MTTAFFDVDTQLDFVAPAGALYVPGAERIVPAVARLNRWAAAHGIPLISTMDAHAENDPEFLRWPPHCVKGTLGQRKPENTRVPDAGQILFEKTNVDVFAERGIDAVLERIGAERYVVYGVVTEICVRFAALGLLKTGKSVVVVRDAVQCLDAAQAGAFFEELQQAGGGLTTLAEIGA
jgi:nicotinamidase/pyrazinamidase